MPSTLIKYAVAGISLLAVAPATFASVWTGGSGNWSDNTATGWNGTGVPDAIGAVADFANGTNGTVTVDVSPRTLGSLTVSLGNFTRSLTLTNGLIMNQDGAGAGTAIISNTNANTGANNRLSIGLGVITLNDDLLIFNSGGSTNTTGAITFSGTLAGSGNLTLNNVSNNLSSGAIQLSGATSTFTGTVSIQRGAVVANSLGNSSNAVTLGSAGNSSTLVSQGSTTNIANSITVANTTGTNMLGSTSTAAASNSIYSGSIILNGGVTLSSVKGAGADVRYTGVISGTGAIRTAGTGETQLGSGSNLTNTYSGNTTLTETSSLVLADNAKLTFYIGASGVNNQITGSGQTLTLDGDFIFNLTGAAAVGSWTIVDVSNLTETFSSTFTVVGFTDNGNNTWTSGNYTFSEATGVLTAVPEPSAALLSGLGIACLLFRARRGSRA